MPPRIITTADRTTIYTCSAGDPTKQAVVFIPGLCCTALAFQKQLEDRALTERVFVITYDVRGQGRSGQPADAAAYTSERQAQDFKAVCEAYGITKPVLAGWSLGGIIAADVVAAYGASYLRGVILLSGFPYASMISAVDNPETGKLVPGLISDDVDVFHKACEGWVDSCLCDPTNEDVLPYAVKMSWVGAITTQHPHARRHILERTQDESALLAAVKAGDLKYLVIQGASDCHIRWEALREWLGKHFEAGGEVGGQVRWALLPECGHAPFWEQPERVRTEILDWLESLRREA